MKISRKPILLVAYDRVDTMTIRRALRELHMLNRLDHAENDENGLAQLRGDEYNRPCLTCSTSTCG
jgi:hypothetical protein